MISSKIFNTALSKPSLTSSFALFTIPSFSFSNKASAPFPVETCSDSDFDRDFAAKFHSSHSQLDQIVNSHTPETSPISSLSDSTGEEFNKSSSVFASFKDALNSSFDSISKENSNSRIKQSQNQSFPITSTSERLLLKDILYRDITVKPQGTDILEPLSKSRLNYFRDMYATVDVTFVAKCRESSDFPDPRSLIPEIAFCGRSNVGKSSLINNILLLKGNKERLPTSAKPGKTQTIDFVNVDNRFHLVDLPGYGFAKAPKELVDDWNLLIGDYLVSRPNLRRIFLLVDSRHGITPIDLDFMDLLENSGISFQIVLTKCDSSPNSVFQTSLESVIANQVVIDAPPKRKNLAHYLFKFRDKITIPMSDFTKLVSPSFKSKSTNKVHPARSPEKKAKKIVRALSTQYNIPLNMIETHGGGSFGLSTLKQFPLTLEMINFFLDSQFFDSTNFLPRITFFPHVIKTSIKEKSGINDIREAIGSICIGTSNKKFNPIIPRDREMPTAAEIEQAKASLLENHSATDSKLLDNISATEGTSEEVLETSGGSSNGLSGNDKTVFGNSFPPPPISQEIKRVKKKKFQSRQITAKKLKKPKAITSTGAGSTKFKRKLREKRDSLKRTKLAKNKN